MKHALLTAVAVASLAAFGCDDKKAETAATPETQKTGEKAGEQAIKTLDAAGKEAKGGVTEVEKMKPDDKMASANAETLRGNIEDLFGKAKQAIKDNKLDDAEKFVQQAKDLKGKLPPDAQAKVDVTLAETEKLIAAAKATMKPAGM